MWFNAIVRKYGYCLCDRNHGTRHASGLPEIGISDEEDKLAATSGFYQLNKDGYGDK